MLEPVFFKKDRRYLEVRTRRCVERQPLTVQIGPDNRTVPVLFFVLSCQYTMDVLLPELLTRIYTSLFGLTTEEAEQALRADGTKVIPPQSA